jgi:hypothetical protein
VSKIDITVLVEKPCPIWLIRIEFECYLRKAEILLEYIDR